MENFKVLGLTDKSIKGIAKKGFSEPTDIQNLTIPVLMNDNINIIAQADTGTGKTAAFGLPLLEKLDTKSNKVQALILAPTRELVVQVCSEIESFISDNNITLTAIYGGQSIDKQISTLKRGVSVVVGTPGRVLDLIRRRKLFLDNIKYFILDEGDEMLNMGFIEDVETIMEASSDDKRMLLFSATMPDRIKYLAENYLGEYSHLKTKTKNKVHLTRQYYYEMKGKDKFEVLTRVIDTADDDFYSIVFCRTKKDVDDISNKLSDKGYPVQGLHGDMSQSQREFILRKFRNRNTKILIATDIAARGIDITELTHVINYSMPNNAENYIHRIGRTGRAGKEGTAITFVTPSDFRSFNYIKQVIKDKIERKDIPSVDSIVKSKKKHISDSVNKIKACGNIDNYKDWAKELIGEDNPEDVLASVLKYSFNNIMNTNSYKDIEDISKPKNKGKSRSKNKRNQSRLFISKGKKSNMNKKDIVKIIEKNTGISKNLIQDIEIYDNFSFINVPHKESEIILDTFGNRKIRKLSIEKANSSNNQSRKTKGRKRRTKAHR